MSKIICEICGTTYPDTAENCPICGCSRDSAAEFLGEDFQADEILEETKDKGGKFTSKKKKEIFDFDEVNTQLDEVEEEENPFEEEDEEYEERGGHNVFVVILLTILIVALLGAAGFLFFKYFLPNMGSEETVPETTAQVQQTEAPTTEARIACETLMLTSGGAELNEPGQNFLLHVKAAPENTTDTIVYTSADESIATVTADGKVTAVAEGETVILITCGDVQTTCPVLVAFEEETAPATEAVEETVDETTDETPAETEATEPAQTGLKDVTLKLKQTDIRLGVYYEYQLMLDCGLNQDEVEWRTEHSHIASVNEMGVVKALKDGVTSVHAKYGDQEVSCIVRCVY